MSGEDHTVEVPLDDPSGITGQPQQPAPSSPALLASATAVTATPETAASTEVAPQTSQPSAATAATPVMDDTTITTQAAVSDSPPRPTQPPQRPPPPPLQTQQTQQQTQQTQQQTQQQQQSAVLQQMVLAPSSQTVSYGGAPRLDKEVELVAHAVHERIPSWQRRLDFAMGRATPLVCNFNNLLALCSTSEARLDAVMTLLQPSGLFKSPPALENIVRAIEVACATPVRSHIAAEIEEIHIVNSIGVTRGVKQIFLALQGSRKVLVCAGLYERGMSGAFTQDEVRDFLEERFRVQEQALVGLFHAPDGILAQLQQRLSTALGKATPILCDLPKILDKLEDQSKRLMVTRLMCHEVGVQRTIGKATAFANQFVNKYFAKTTPEPAPVLNIGTEGPAPSAMYSPQVLFPLLNAIETAALDLSNKAVLSNAIQEVYVQLNPGRHVISKGLSLHRALGEPALTPSDFWGPDPPSKCVLLYTMTLEVGEPGVLTVLDINNFLESFFRCQEQSSINQLLNVTVPHLCDRLRQCLGVPVAIELIWSTILPTAIAFDREARMDIVNTLCNSGSQLVLVPIVEAIEDLARSADARNVLSSTIERIVVQGVQHQGSMLVSLVTPLVAPSISSLSLGPGTAAGQPHHQQQESKPTEGGSHGAAVLPEQSLQEQSAQAAVQQQQVVPAAQEMATPNTLLVSNALILGSAGCIGYSPMKTSLRSIFRLPNTDGSLNLGNAGRVIGHEARRLEHEINRFGKSLQQRFFPSLR